MTGVLVEMANLSNKIRAGDLEAVDAKATDLKKLIEDAVGVVRNMALLPMGRGNLAEVRHHRFNRTTRGYL